MRLHRHARLHVRARVNRAHVFDGTRVTVDADGAFRTDSPSAFGLTSFKRPKGRRS